MLPFAVVMLVLVIFARHAVLPPALGSPGMSGASARRAATTWSAASIPAPTSILCPSLRNAPPMAVSGDVA